MSAIPAVMVAAPGSQRAPPPSLESKFGLTRTTAILLFFTGILFILIYSFIITIESSFKQTVGTGAILMLVGGIIAIIWATISLFYHHAKKTL